MAYVVYIVECKDKTLYVGITTDVERRLVEHNSRSLGAAYTKSRRPVKLVYVEKQKNRSEASKREYEIKQWSRAEKLNFLKLKHKLKKKMIVVRDKMQKNYSYELTEPDGKNFDPAFKPFLTPKQMLKLGVFGGKYLNDCKKEFPSDWFKDAKLSPQKKDPSINFFKVDASQPLAEWKKKGWIHKDDPRGWFQWYCRYYMGRRIEKEDMRQIKRWRAMTRHVAQISHKCRPGDLHCNVRQRQALLHWAYDSRKI